MAHTLSASTKVVRSIAVSRPVTRRLLTGGLVAGPLFLGTGIVQGLTRDGFGFTRNAISQLALGDLGWIQVANFLLTGALVIAGAIGMRRVLRGVPGGIWAPRLVGVFGASFLAAAVFPADAGAGFPIGAPEATSLSAHGAVHMITGMVGYLALCAAFPVLARCLGSLGHRGWAVAARLVPVGVLAGFAGSSVSVLAFTVGAGLGLAGMTAVMVRLVTEAPAANR
ncbi:DUF998 domain-containing protein [Streptomyces sp. NBC_00347]|uniref:DUF998 domain-containing protein n=1 Tax=Streptomyces sp. NBC_00347 TaxID=2975721 RepID=UPI002251FA33|nr:DUF998 domain-containing protein [Streptomyces sp. NBC_00347]MCX5123743.1 DUF998 domain-containing protein [Streptomyces sp. NBC_00347]